MDWVQATVLAVLQGLTEFLPISSSAHLILVPHLFGWVDQGLSFDVAVHVGSLTAVLFYFRIQLRELTSAWWCQLRGGRGSPDSRLAWALIIATVPVVLLGGGFNDSVETYLRHPLIIAAATLIFALVLWWSDRAGARTKTLTDLTWPEAIAIGCAQAVALVPGTSRSGITMSAGLWLGLTRKEAARFSFLLSIPVILLAGVKKSLDLLAAPGPVSWLLVWWGAIVSGVMAFLCIHWFLKLIERAGVLPFVWYRIVLAVALFWIYL